MSNNYANRQAERDRQYAAAYETQEVKEWIANMKPEERRHLEAEGLLRPLIQNHGSGMSDEDLADSPLASETPDIAAAIDKTEVINQSTHDERADVLASFCAHVRGCANPVLAFDAICYATGVSSLEGQSGVELAKKHGVTKQAFSKIAVEWCETFGLQPSRSMKSKAARKVYANRAKRIHAKHRKLTRSQQA